MDGVGTHEGDICVGYAQLYSKVRRWYHSNKLQELQRTLPAGLNTKFRLRQYDSKVVHVHAILVIEYRTPTKCLSHLTLQALKQNYVARTKTLLRLPSIDLWSVLFL